MFCQDDSCTHNRGDCVGDVTVETEMKLYECVGEQSCSIEVGVGWIGECRAYSDYNYVIYSCVAGARLSLPRSQVGTQMQYSFVFCRRRFD